MGKLTKKQYRRELRSMLERIDELTAENRRIMAGKSEAQSQNNQFMAELDGLNMELNNTETDLKAAERAIRHHEAKFDSAAEFTGKLIRYSNEQ